MAALSLVQATDIVDAALDKARCSYPAARIGARNFPPARCRQCRILRLIPSRDRGSARVGLESTISPRGRYSDEFTWTLR